VDPGNGKWGRRPDRVEDGRQGSSSSKGGRGSLPMLGRRAVEEEVYSRRQWVRSVKSEECETERERLCMYSK